MEALTRRFVVPMMPAQPANLKVVYPWETTNIYNLGQQLFELASKTGYLGTFEEFKTHFGEYLESGSSIIDYDIYTGQYQVTPLPNVEQILRTQNRLLKHDIIIEQIPYYETTNLAGGYTAIIG